MPATPVIVRLSGPLALFAAVAWLVAEANTTGNYVIRNLLPALAVVIGSVVILRRGDGRWFARGARWPLALAGFSVPAVGLTVYLHLAYALDWRDIASNARTPWLLFRFLPYYAMFAGLIGAAIGWIVGRDADARRQGRHRR